MRLKQQTIQAVVSPEFKDAFLKTADDAGLPASSLARVYITKGLAQHQAAKLTASKLVDEGLTPTIEKAERLLSMLRPMTSL